MNIKIFSFFYILQYCRGVIVNQGTKYDVNDIGTQDKTGKWKIVKVFHPLQPSLWQNYESFVQPNYEFEYAVSSQATGDHKYQREARRGGRVRGEYGLREADGSLRHVHYRADDKHGFNAVITKSFLKHGEDSYSMFGHTRHFQGFGQGVKINNYFPGKNYKYPKYESMMSSVKSVVPDDDKIKTLEPVAVDAKPIQAREDLMKKQEILAMPEKNINPKSNEDNMMESMRKSGIEGMNSLKEVTMPETTTTVPAEVHTAFPLSMTLMINDENANMRHEVTATPVPVEKEIKKTEKDKKIESKIEEMNTDTMGSSSFYKNVYYVLY